jgi:hypothetical protein
LPHIGKDRIGKPREGGLGWPLLLQAVEHRTNIGPDELAIGRNQTRCLWPRRQRSDPPCLEVLDDIGRRADESRYLVLPQTERGAHRTEDLSENRIDTRRPLIDAEQRDSRL